jgi:hypothetical protein
MSAESDVSNGDEDFVVVRVNFARRYEKDHYGWVSVMVPRHSVDDLSFGTLSGNALGEALLDRELVEWDEEDDPDFCHSPYLFDVEEDQADAPFCGGCIDDEGKWWVGGFVVWGYENDGEEVADEQA